MAEVVAIVNPRPTSVLMSDPDDPKPLSTHDEDTSSWTPSRSVPMPQHLRASSLPASLVPTGAVMDKMAMGVPTELAASTEVDRDTAGPVCRRFCPHARQVAALQ